ncbi:MAG TPA: RNA 2',3'-cyclic phosphodiesterase [Candidatus Babeliales bacterium]|nr:RNA 2',3'-cyclic phosphodiesterase [Candidatus Babeliales bacterium]
MAEPAARKRRLFVGVALDEPARTSCAAVVRALQETGFDARYELPEKLHVTLAFLGFVDPSRFDEIVAGLTRAGAGSKRFRITFDKLGAFPHERRPRVIYVGARDQGAGFRNLAKSVRKTFAEMGFEFKEDAVAHVTIARVKEAKRPLPLVEVAPTAVEIQGLALFESLPDPARKTSRYEIVATAAL